MRALAVSTAWLLAGAGVAAVLFWGFLNTPESTGFMLAISAALAVALYVVLAVTLAGGLLGWQRGWRGVPLGGALRGVVLCVPALLLVLGTWWGVERWLAWLASHQGAISAWFIATLDWPDVRPLLRATEIGSNTLRWAVVPFAALVWVADALAGEWRPVRSWRVGTLARVAVAGAIAAATVWAPLTYGLYWRPRGLPPTWVEVPVAAAKFAGMALLAAIGVSLILRLAVRPSTTT